MEDGFSTLLALIPLAILIAVRMIAAKKKKADTAGRKSVMDMLLRAAEPPPRRAPPSAEEQFSAFALKPDDDEPPPPPPVPKQAYRPLLVASPGETPVHVSQERMVPPAPQPGPAVGAVTGPKPVHQAEPLGVFPARVERLPSLKKAIVLAELIGSPKALRSDE